MRLYTDRDVGYRTITVTWSPVEHDAAAQAFDEHGVSDGEHIEPSHYEAVRDRYSEIVAAKTE